MARCSRCCLHASIRIVNIITSLFATGMIIYSLWLLKKWNEGVAQLPSIACLPRPWFIYTCLAVGMVVCLSSLFGHMVANCFSNSTLCIYIVTICSLVLIEVTVLVAVFFRIDWYKLIIEYIDEHYTKFRSFVIFHLKTCQIILILILVLQLNAIALAILLWAFGTQPRTDSRDPEMHVVIQSFLVGPSSSFPGRQICGSCENLPGEYARESFWSYIKGVFRMRFQRISVLNS